MRKKQRIFTFLYNTLLVIINVLGKQVGILKSFIFVIIGTKQRIINMYVNMKMLRIRILVKTWLNQRILTFVYNTLLIIINLLGNQVGTLRSIIFCHNRH